MRKKIDIRAVRKLGLVAGHACEVELPGKLSEKAWEEIVGLMQREFKAIGTRATSDGQLREFKVGSWRYVLESGESRDRIHIQSVQPGFVSLKLVSPIVAMIGIVSSFSLGGFKTFIAILLQLILVFKIPLGHKGYMLERKRRIAEYARISLEKSSSVQSLSEDVELQSTKLNTERDRDKLLKRERQ